MGSYSSKEIARRVEKAKRAGWKELDLTACRVQDADLRQLLSESGVENLRAIDLSLNGLCTLPPEIGRLTALVNLNLNYNAFSALSPEIGRLRALKKLCIWRNQLSTLPPEICRLTALKHLLLSNNELSSLPSQIGSSAR